MLWVTQKGNKTYHTCYCIHKCNTTIKLNILCSTKALTNSNDMKFNAQYQKGIPESILYSNDDRNDFDNIITQASGTDYLWLKITIKERVNPSAYLKIVLWVEMGLAPCLEDAFKECVMLTSRARGELYPKIFQYFTFQSANPFSKSNVTLLSLFSVSIA